MLLTPDIFDVIDSLAPGAGGEYQLTDAIKVKANAEGILALDFEGERFDMGAKIGFLKANVVKGVLHPETKEEFKAFLKAFVKTLE